MNMIFSKPRANNRNQQQIQNMNFIHKQIKPYRVTSITTISTTPNTITQ